MQNIKSKQIITFGMALVVSVLAMLAITTPKAFAATKTWTGGGSDDSFSTSANWSPSGAPTNGDDLVFPGDTSLLADNDAMTTINSITVNANTDTDPHTVTISGNDITIGSTVTVGSKAALSLDSGVALSANFTAALADKDTTISIGETGETFALGAFTANFVSSVTTPASSSDMADVFIESPVTGTSASVLSFEKIRIFFPDAASPSFNGEIQLNKALLFGDDDFSGNLGTVGKGIIMTNSRIAVSPTVALTINDPIHVTGNFLGASNSEAEISTEAIYVGGTSGAGFVLAGGLTLGSDILVDPYQGPLTITGPFAGQFLMGITAAYTATSKIVINSSANTGLIPNGDYGLVDSDATAADSLPAQDLILERGVILIVNGQRGRVIVSAQSTLKGSGTVGAIDVFTGGKLAPGQSPGCLSSGNLSLTSGSTFEAELGGTTACTGYDQLAVTGTVTLGNATLSTLLYNGFVPASGNTFTIISNDGTDAVSGTFNGLAQGATVTVGGSTFTISYTGGDGNDVVLTAGTAPTVVAPAPSTPATGFGSLGTNPIVTLLATTTLAGTIIMVNNKYRKSQKRG